MLSGCAQPVAARGCAVLLSSNRAEPGDAALWPLEYIRFLVSVFGGGCLLSRLLGTLDRDSGRSNLSCVSGL